MTWMFNTFANTYVNSVNLALIEVPGWPFRFSTFGNFGGGRVRIPGDIIPGGFGPKNGGRLSSWIIDAPSVIPKWPIHPWIPVFDGGLHSIVGWSDVFFSGNTVVTDTAKAIRRFNRPVAAAFLEEAYMDPLHRHIAVALFPCGHWNDRIPQLQGLDWGKPKCLSIRYWL
ncbi:hypothetical protein DFP72DRAFT_1163380 [Ephemerocybe angulata]|uniref:Uncharacterized protein n=1 Tax=Ephemerocybe angulata TaxID=980116 RepID=A0A8H6MGY9_9AGAR|nr:hypothetical protein DFP72DRAFT_1163380 [Tulosesus angulatus]